MPTADELIYEAEIEKMDKRARAAGFLTLCPGEVYTCELHQTTHVFIMLVGEKWSSWRETWKEGKLHSNAQKMIVENVPFEIALQKAKSYAQFITKKRGMS